MSDLISKEALKTIKSIQSADFNSIETIREWIDNVPTIPAIPISVIEQIKAEIKNYLEDEKYSENGISDVGIGLELSLNIINRVIKE